MKIGNRITQLRENKNFSVYKLSKLSEVSSTYIHEIELDKKQPTVEILSKICSALDITLTHFFQESTSEIDLPDHIQKLVTVAQSLSVEEVQLLTKFISKIKKNKEYA